MQALPTFPSKYIPHQSASPRFHRSSLQSRHGHPWSTKIPILLTGLPACPHTDSLSSSYNGLLKSDRDVTHPHLQFKACLAWASQRGPAALSGLALTTSPASDSYLPHFPSSSYTTSFLPLKSRSSCLLRYICICCLFPPRTFFSRMLSSPHPSSSAQRSLPQVFLTVLPIIPLRPSPPTTALSH